jgi:hypothetical protein
LVPEKMVSLPLNVPSIKANIKTQEIVDIVPKGRKRENKPLERIEAIEINRKMDLWPGTFRRKICQMKKL